MKTGSSPSSCEDGFQGEVEDYVANINLSLIKSGEIQSVFTSNQDQIISSEFNVYPNPASDKIYLQFFNWLGNKEICFIDLTGKVVLFKEISVEFLEVDLSLYPDGIYLIEAKNENFRKWKKIRIQ
jgi:hypothetical protein